MELTEQRERSGPSETDPGEIRGLLAAAQGYAVLGRDRKRVGIFIEFADADGERIAVRRDGVFVWRRELLSLATVATVLPERRVILLNVESSSLDEEPVAAPDPTDAADWRGRIARYVSPGEGEDPEIPRREDSPVDRHLRFISTSAGYRLVEAEGRPPSAGSTVAVPEQVGSFLVLKLGPSPLPNDDRVCAYLAPR